MVGLSWRDQRFAEACPSAPQLIGRFSKDYGCKYLVWFEGYDDLQEARHRELQMKKWKRAWKLELIERENPRWNDLYDVLF
jgi:putative endonuclease